MANLFFIYSSQINHSNSACVQLLPWLMRNKGWFSWANHVLTLVWCFLAGFLGSYHTPNCFKPDLQIIFKCCWCIGTSCSSPQVSAHAINSLWAGWDLRREPLSFLLLVAVSSLSCFLLIYPFSLTWSLFKVFHGKVYNSCLARRVVSVVD